MKEININSVGMLLEKLNELPNSYMYRGHGNADWKLESSLERVIGKRWSAESAKKFEEYSLEMFKSKFHLYDTENLRPDSTLAWLSIMQHYGIPTRLLDFTESPYVALYFAIEAYSPQAKSDLAIFAIDYSKVMQHSIDYISKKNKRFRETRQSVYKNQDMIFERVVDRFGYDIAWIAEPKLLNARLDRQAGSFLLSGNRGHRIEEVLKLPLYSTTGIIKYRISKNLYTNLFAVLRKMNVTSKSLYGDLEGLSRSIRMQLQVYSV